MHVAYVSLVDINFIVLDWNEFFVHRNIDYNFTEMTTYNINHYFTDMTTCNINHYFTDITTCNIHHYFTEMRLIILTTISLR